MAVKFGIGRRFQGKTTLGVYEVRRCPRRLIFDPRGMIRGEASYVVTSKVQLRTAITAMMNNELTEIVYTPNEHEDTLSAYQAFTIQAAAIFKFYPSSRIGVLVDDVRLLGRNPQNLMTRSMEWIVRASNVDRTVIMFTAHRCIDIPTDIRAIADQWYLFRCTLANDIDVVRRVASERVAIEVQQLKDRCFVEWNDQEGKALYHMDPSKWFVRLADRTLAPSEDPLDPELEGTAIPEDAPKHYTSNLWEDD